MGIFANLTARPSHTNGNRLEAPIKRHNWKKHSTDIIGPVIEALPGPVFVIDANTHIISVNRAAQRLFPSMSLGEPLSKSLRASDLLDAVMRVMSAQTSEKAAWIEKSAVERRFEASVAPLAVEGYEIAVVISLQDLTEAHRVERMRVDFVANASHELRTPLASILGFVETLEGPAKNDETARDKFLKIIREQTKRMSRLVDDLLSLSRIEQHMHVRPATPVDLSLLVAHIVDTLAPITENEVTPLSLNIEPNIIVPGDRDELARVLENLIENALKYGSSDTSDEAIEISLSRQGKLAIFQVRDHGPGIASDHLPRLTERFYRVDPGKSKSKGGTGLGLAIVKHIVLRHRGRLLIESSIGNGAQFRVIIPTID